MAPEDPRLKVGACVNARATLVTSKQECQRLFGRVFKSKTAEGRVEKVIQRRVNNRMRRFLDCTWAVGTVKKRKELPLGSVKIGPYPKPPGGWPERQVELTYPLEDAVSEEMEVESAEGGVSSSRQNVSIGTANDVPAARVTPNEATENQHDARAVSPPTRQTVAHGQVWDFAESVRHPINGAVQYKFWKVETNEGQTICEGVEPDGLKPLNYFYSMFPMAHLTSIVSMTNENLQARDKSAATPGEILKFFGVLIMMTRFKFGNRKELWNVRPKHKYIPAAQFGRFISYQRFDDLRSCIRFGKQPEERGGLSTEAYRWTLCDDFVEAINANRRDFVKPSHLLCVDESISRWYGVGGNYIDVGLPHYVALERKPERGCEIHAVACGKSQIMMGIAIVKSVENDHKEDTSDNNGTGILKRMCGAWFGTGRLICGDSAFASVQAAEEMFKHGLRFTGVVKTATKKYPMAFLSEREMRGRGDWASLTSKATSSDGSKFDLLAIGWVDRNRRYFISTAGDTTPGTVQKRLRWKREDDVSAQELIQVSWPSMVETYYSCASAVDRHNRVRQDDLDIEKSFEVRDWSMRVNSSLLAICVVDAFQLYKGGRGARTCMSPNDFFSTLACQLIDNEYDGKRMETGAGGVLSGDSGYDADVSANDNEGLLRRTNMMRRKKDGTRTNSRLQRRCRVCGKKSRFYCVPCKNNDSGLLHFCGEDVGRKCFATHIAEDHSAN